MRSISTFLAALLSVHISYAFVDMRSGGLTEAFTDIPAYKSNFSVGISRIYKSKSIYNGLFGFGWCAYFETRLIVQKDSLVVNECGNGPEIKFNQSKNAKTFTATGIHGGFIEARDGKYIQHQPDKVVRIFDADGKIQSVKNFDGRSIKYQYKEGRLVQINEDESSLYSLKYGSNGKISEIQLGAVKVSYSYEGLSLVKAEVKRGDVLVKQDVYAYDAFYNLTSISSEPEKRNVKIKYNQNDDLVVSVASGNCTEDYSYEVNLSALTQTVKAIETCEVNKKKKTKANVYSITYKKEKSGELKESVVTKNVQGSVQKYIYNSATGRKSKTVANGIEINFEYYPTGLLKSRKSKYMNVELAYDPKGQVKSVDVTLFKDNNKKSVLRSVASYDLSGRVNAVKSSDGAAANYVYDDLSRISSVTATEKVGKKEVKKQLKVTYTDARFQVARITEGDGKNYVELTYAPDGSLEKMSGPSGETNAAKLYSFYTRALALSDSLRAENYQ